MNETATLREQANMIAKKINPGEWYAREVINEVEWPEDKRWVVESQRGFCIEVVCSELLDTEGDLIIDFGEYPYTVGFTEDQAEAIIKILNKRSRV